MSSISQAYGADRRTTMALRPQILLVSELFPPAVGGSAVLFENVYSRIVDFETLVLTDPIGGASRPPGPFRFEYGSIRTPHWGVGNVRGLSHHLRTAFRIRKISRNLPRIVHCGRALPEGVAAAFSRFFGGPRYVCWAHGEDIGTARTSRELTLVMTRVYRGAEAVFANSINTSRALESLGIPRNRLQVVYPGVDASRFHPQQDGSAIRNRYAKGGELLILSVGRLQRRKGHDLAIQALRRLSTSGLSIRYLIVGTGKEEERLRNLAEAEGVGDRVHFVGQVSDAELPSYYAACDIFLLPNRLDGNDVEGFGIVFLEAQATSRPAVGGRSGGVPEAIAEGETGFLVEGTDADELAAVLWRLSESSEIRRRLGAAGRARVLEHFTWERAARAVADLHGRIGHA